jgi:hypothetical protein
MHSPQYFRCFKKYPPSYFETLQDYPQSNPVLIAVESHSFQTIRRLKSICLLCNQWPGSYDLSCCFDREVWVLHSNEENLSAALRLAEAVQQSGAAEIIIIRLGE